MEQGRTAAGPEQVAEKEWAKVSPEAGWAVSVSERGGSAYARIAAPRVLTRAGHPARRSNVLAAEH